MYRSVFLLLLSMCLAGCSSSGPQAPAAKPQIISFNATPTSGAVGQTVTLNWTVAGTVTSLDIQPAPGTVSVTSTSATVNPTTTTTYTLTARSGAESVSRPVTVTVSGGGGGGGDGDGGGGGGGGGGGNGSNQNPTVAIGGDSERNTTVGQPVNLTATGSDPEGGTISYSWSANPSAGVQFTNAAAASTSVTFASVGNYTVTISVSDGNGGGGSDSVAFNVAASGGGGGNPPGDPPEITSFTVAPGMFYDPNAMQWEAGLYWEVTGDVTSLSIDNGVGDVMGLDHINAILSQTTTYTLTATNSYGNDTAELTVTVTAEETFPEEFGGNWRWSLLSTDGTIYVEGYLTVDRESTVYGEQGGQGEWTWCVDGLATCQNASQGSGSIYYDENGDVYTEAQDDEGRFSYYARDDDAYVGSPSTFSGSGTLVLDSVPYDATLYMDHP